MSRSKRRHADNSGNHADLWPIKIYHNIIVRLNSTWNSSFITEHKMPFMNTSKAAKMVGWPNRERQMYKCHEPYESCRLVNPILHGHIREFNRLKQHSSHDLVFKIWRNNTTEATSTVFCLWLWLTSVLASIEEGGRGARDWLYLCNPVSHWAPVSST